MHKRTNFISVLTKDMTLTHRAANEWKGVLVFVLLLVVVFSGMIRNLSLTNNELVYVIAPAAWLIFIFAMLRISMLQNEEEISKGLFFYQIRLGTSAHTIFYSKVIILSLLAVLVCAVELFGMMVLLGDSELMPVLKSFALSLVVSIPGVSVIVFIGAILSLRMSNREILMPVIVFPLLLLLSWSVIESSVVGIELLNSGGTITEYISGFWPLMIVGLSCILLFIGDMLSEPLLKMGE